MCANCKTCTYSFPKQNATSLWNRFLHRGLSNPNRNLWRYLNPVSCSIHDVTVCGLCFDAQQIKSQPWPMVLVKWRLPGLPGLLRLPVYSRLDSSAVVSYQSCDCVVGKKKTWQVRPSPHSSNQLDYELNKSLQGQSFCQNFSFNFYSWHESYPQPLWRSIIMSCWK